jgi:nucleoside-diphosphate kinase
MIGSILTFLYWALPAMAANRERSFIMIKPDGVQRGLVGDIIKRFEQKGFKLVAIKFMNVFIVLYFDLSNELIALKDYRY